METIEQNKTPQASRSHRALWLAALAAILAWQAWLTLGLFGENPWTSLFDDRPVLSGSHPQHLYLGSVGAKALQASGSSCAYDRAHAAGYLKTPIFNGSRFAEVFLYLGGGDYSPAAYKIGLLFLCLLVPLLLILASVGVGLPAPATCLATVAGLLLWWGPVGRAALEAGDIELLIASLALLAHVGLLIRFDHQPGLLSWLGLFATGALGWFAQPLLFPIALPLLLVYYFHTGVRHGSLTWHLTLWAAQLSALVINLPWLLDWFSYWWLRSDLPVNSGILAHRTLRTLWHAPLWGGPLDRALAMVLLASALAGTWVWHHQHQRPASRLLGFGAALLLVLALLGISWEPLGQVGTSALLIPALWFATLPAAYFWVWALGHLLQLGLPGRAGLIAATAGLGVLAVIGREDLGRLGARCLTTTPLQIGLGPQREALIEKLTQHTGPEARILWEDRRLPRHAPRWSALLPVLTGRSFLGGLDPDGTIEHSSISFLDQALQDLPIATWSDQALQEYCRRYNVGWVVAWSPAVIKRFSEWDGAVEVTSLLDDDPGYLFLIKHAERSYALKGKAQLVQADSRHITLADVVPENGVVVLSLHYQTGMRASPSRVQVEREPCGRDPIGFVRLRIAGPVARVSLLWGNP